MWLQVGQNFCDPLVALPKLVPCNLFDYKSIVWFVGIERSCYVVPVPHVGALVIV